MKSARRIVAITLAVLFLSACEGTNKREIGTAVGAAVGLGLGIVLALATGSDLGDAGVAIGGAIGAAVGAAIGGSLGDGLDREDQARAAVAAAAAAALPDPPPVSNVSLPAATGSPPAATPAAPALRADSASVRPPTSAAHTASPVRVAWSNPQNPMVRGYSEPVTPAVSSPSGICRQVRSVYLVDGRENTRDSRFCFRNGAWQEAA